MNPRRVTTTDGTPLLLTMEAAAAELSVGRSTVYGLVKTGELRSVRIGRVRRVPADALTEYVAGLSEAS